MNMKSVEMSANPVNKFEKKETRSKNEASEFRDILNQNSANKMQASSVEEADKAREEITQVADQEEGNIKENENTADDGLQSDGEQELSDTLSVINLMAAMQSHVKPEIQVVSVKDGKVNIPVVENAGKNALNLESTRSTQLEVIISNQGILEKGKIIKNLDEAVQNLDQSVQNLDNSVIKQSIKPQLEVKKSQDNTLQREKNTLEITDAVKVESENTKTIEKSALKSDSPKSVLKEDEMISQVLKTEPKIQEGEEVKVIIVKVGDAQKAGSAEFTREIAKNIDITSNGKNSYELQLDPANLGKIKVSISFEQGQTNISLICNSARTAGLLSENALMLAQIIQANNGTTALVNVQEESGYLSQEKGENHNQQGGQNEQNPKNDDSEEFADQMKLGLWEIENLKRQYQMSQIS